MHSLRTNHNFPVVRNRSGIEPGGADKSAPYEHDESTSLISESTICLTNAGEFFNVLSLVGDSAKNLINPNEIERNLLQLIWGYGRMKTFKKTGFSLNSLPIVRRYNSSRTKQLRYKFHTKKGESICATDFLTMQRKNT